MVLCGLGFALAGLALPIGAAGPISMALAATAMVVTIVQLLRLRKPRPHAPRLNKQHNIVNDDDLRAAECAGSVTPHKSPTLLSQVVPGRESSSTFGCRWLVIHHF